MLRALLTTVVPPPLHTPGQALGRRLRVFRHRGRAVECPICGGHFARFLPHGAPQRPGARCPGCDTLERHRLLCCYLYQRTDLFARPLRLLHVAPESELQRMLRRAANIEYVSADLDSPLAELHFDLTGIPFPHGSFDVILCSHVLEHIPDDAAAMRELRRVLAPTGWAVIEVPIDHGRAVTYEDPSITDPEERLRAFGQRDHVRWYGRDFVDRLRAAGCQVTEDRYAATLDEAERRRFGIAPDTMHLCRPALAGR